MNNKAVIGIGSNMYPEKNIQRALEWLTNNFRLLRVTSFVKTAPIGITNQPWFINGAVLIQTNLNKQALRQEFKKFEDQMGRDRSAPKFGPRCIDLDVVVWNGVVVDKDVYSRDFLKEAVMELCPEAIKE